ncbi:uncharacterized protein [Danio rerio]|uniref:SGNH hydrolase-type esterase domain-containing protein n=1 Tax=Danio rerio TaxID=7955 RepID=A0AB32TLS3_DANRE
MAFIKEESEDVKIEETFTVKQEDLEEQTGSVRTQRKTPAEATDLHTVIKMAFIKEESEDVEIEETFTVKQEDLQEQTGPIVYVIGDSYIRRGEEQARQTVGTNLGLNAHIRWFGCGGLVWRNLVSFFHRCLEGRAVPDVLLIHCGGNDLGNIKSVILAAVMKQDLQDLHRQFPQMKIIFSAITQRCLWRSAESLRKVDRARRFVNHAMATIMVSVGGAIVHHPEITYKDPGHFLHDRVHLTPLGNDIFLKNLAQCLKNQIQ